MSRNAAARDRGHDADGARKGGQRTLPFGREPAGRGEARFQALEFFVERADAGEAHGLHVELELAARFVDGGRGANLDRETVLQREAGELGLLPEEHAAHLRRGVLQVEIAMARGRAREIRYLPGDPDEAEMALENEPRGADEEANRQDRRRTGAIGRVAGRAPVKR